MFKLSPLNKRLLGLIDLRDIITREELAKSLKIRTPSAHYAVNTLIENGALTRRARIDFFKLGMVDVAIYFSLSEARRGARTSLERELVADTRVGWLCKLAGEYQYGVILLVRSLDHVARFIYELRGAGGIIVGDLVMAPRVSYTQCNRKYLSNFSGASRRVAFSACEDMWCGDALDRRILSYLGVTPFDSIRSLALAIGVPASTVEARIEVMRRVGVIRGFYYEANPIRFGMQCFRLLLTTSGAQLELLKRFDEWCLQHRDVVFMVRAIGAWEYEIGLEVGDATQVLQFVGEVSELIGVNLRGVRVLQEVTELKWSFYPGSAV